MQSSGCRMQNMHPASILQVVEHHEWKQSKKVHACALQLPPSPWCASQFCPQLCESLLSVIPASMEKPMLASNALFLFNLLFSWSYSLMGEERTFFNNCSKTVYSLHVLHVTNQPCQSTEKTVMFHQLVFLNF